MLYHEHLVKAEHSLGFAVDDLQDANKQAGNVASIVCLQLLRDAVALRDRICQLRQAEGVDA